MYRLPYGTPLPKWVRIFGNADQTHPDYPKVERMAELVSEAISQLLPEGYELRESRGEIAFVRRGELVGWGIGVAATYFYTPEAGDFPEGFELPAPEEYETDDDQFVRNCAENVLNSVQDWITEELTWPWPEVPGRRTVMPDCHAELEGRVLRVWYGTDGVPVTRVIEVALPDWTTLHGVI